MKFRAIPVSIKLDDSAQSRPESIPADVQIMRTGTFNFGEKGDLTITTAMLKSMISNFKTRVRGVDLAIDYKHDSDDVAAGWIKDLYLANEDKELWAKVDWTPKGRQVLSDKEFRYLSADFHLNFKHNETNETHGPTLFGAGLTNRPFIKEMEPVVNLSEKPKGNKQMDDKDKQIADLTAQVESLKKQIEDDGKEEGDGDQPQMADMKKQNASLAAQCADLQKKVQAFEASAADAEKAKQLAEKKAVFDGLMLVGKAVEAQREAFMSGDTVKFAESFKQPNLGGSGSSNDAPPAPKDSMDAQNQIAKLAEEKMSKDVKLSMGEAIRLVLSENKDLKAKYQG